MGKVFSVIAAVVVALGVCLAVVGCGSSTNTPKDRMGGDKMGGDKMGGDKMGGDKMGGDKKEKM
jgi:pentapeptide MXKDX repeat protein